MTESRKLISAREHLAKAEANYAAADSLFHLEEGLTLLEEMTTDDAGNEAKLANNLASTYANRLCAFIRKRVDADRAVPEPQLEHYFNVLRTFDQRGFALPDDARETKISIARRLVDRYLEGHSSAEKAAALEQLTRITTTAEPVKRRRGRE